MFVLNEYLKGKNLFTDLNSKIDFEFIHAHKDELNFNLSLMFGDRTVFSKLLSFDYDMLLSTIKTVFYSKWKKLLIFNESDFKIGVDGNKITETRNNHYSNNDLNSEDVHKRSAYNTNQLYDEYSDVKRSDNRESGNSDGLIKEFTYNIDNIIVTLNTMTKSNIINIILSDVANMLTISTYRNYAK